MTAGFVTVPTIVPLKAFVAGGRKNHVDTTTKIELRSETEGTVVYYTVNGKRPVPYDRLRGTSGHTFRYSAPFYLAVGKVAIKAMATSHDGRRESSVVTKTFLVDKATQEEEEREDWEEEKELSPMASPQRPGSSPVLLPRSLSAQLRQRISLGKTTPTPLPSSPLPRPPTTASTTHSPEKQLTTTSTRSASAPVPVTTHPILPSPSPLPTSPPPQPRCSHCEMPYSKTSRHRYCSQCGAGLPSLPHRDSRPPTQMSVCSGCGVRVQPDVQHCPTCDSAVVKPHTPHVIRGQTTSPLGEDCILCSECGTRNLTSHNSCITCNTPLHPPSPSPSSSPPPPPLSLPVAPVIIRPISGQSYAMCGRCGRVNVSDARFCDWCGSKPARSQVSVLCGECSAVVDWRARHCTSCGAIVTAPPRSGVELGSTMKMPSGAKLGVEGWVPVVDIQVDKPVVRNQASQTDRFYQSARTLHLKREAEKKQQVIQTVARDRVRKLDGFSPGRGFWRVQVDHVCAHLKAHSLSSPDFQNDIGSPQMGKLVSSEVLTGESAVDIRLTFAMKEGHVEDRDDTFKASRPPPPRSRRASLGSQTSEMSAAVSQTSRERRRAGRHDSLVSGGSRSVGSTGRTEGERGRGRGRRSVLPARMQLHQQLVAELAEGGAGRETVVQELLQKGADVNGTDSRGVPLLSLAAAGGHTSCVNVLLNSGAFVNTQAKRTKNTALHEAVQRGPPAKSCIHTLLDRGGSAALRNRNGETPCQLANRLGHSDLVSCFTAHESQRLMNSLPTPSNSTP